MLNDPEQLRRFSEMYLSIRPISPAQFTSLADLDSHLPPPFDTQRQAANMPLPTAIQSGAVPAAAAPPVVATELVPPPPAPVARMPEHKIVATRPAGADTGLTHSMAVTEVSPADQRVSGQRSAEQRPIDIRPIELHPGELRPADQHAADKRLSEQHAAEPRTPHPPDTRIANTRVADTRVADTRANDAKPAEIRLPPLPVRTAAALPQPLPSIQPKAAPPQPVPYTGSLLGMAHGAVPSPVPRPTPVNATNWYNAN
jgi:hypothetical protein